MTYREITRQIELMAAYCENLPNTEELGEKAMELIGDYPLYVSGLSNIRYGDAIAIATLMFGDVEKAYVKNKEQDSLMEEYSKTDREHSLDDFDKWVAERSKNA